MMVAVRAAPLLRFWGPLRASARSERTPPVDCPSLIRGAQFRNISRAGSQRSDPGWEPGPQWGILEALLWGFQVQIDRMYLRMSVSTHTYPSIFIHLSICRERRAGVLSRLPGWWSASLGTWDGHHMLRASEEQSRLLRRDGTARPGQNRGAEMKGERARERE